MVGTILPAGSGERVGVMGTLHLAGSVVGGAAVGAVCGGLGWAVGAQRLPAAAVLALLGGLSVLYGAHDLELARLPAPQRTRQVTSRWRVTLPPRRSSFNYGLTLGTGVLTFIPLSGLYVVLAWAVGAGRWWQAVAAMAVFGAGRALPIFLLATVWRAGARRWLHLVESLQTWAPVPRFVSGAFLSVVGGALLWGALRA